MAPASSTRLPRASPGGPGKSSRREKKCGVSRRRKFLKRSAASSLYLTVCWMFLCPRKLATHECHDQHSPERSRRRGAASSPAAQCERTRCGRTWASAARHAPTKRRAEMLPVRAVGAVERVFRRLASNDAGEPFLTLRTCRRPVPSSTWCHMRSHNSEARGCEPRKASSTFSWRLIGRQSSILPSCMRPPASRSRVASCRP